MNPVKPSRAPLTALFVVANPNNNHPTFRNLAVPGVAMHVTQPSDLRRDLSRTHAQVLVIENAVPGAADVIAQVRSSLPSIPILFLTEQLSDVAAAVAA